MNHAIPPNEPTPLQAAIQAARATLANAWLTLLSSEQKDSYRDAAEAEYATSGYALFTRLMWPRAVLGLSITQPYAAYGGPLLTIASPVPTLTYDADLNPPSDPEPCKIYPFCTPGDYLEASTWPTLPCIAFARLTHFPVPGGRAFQPFMATAADSAALANSFLAIPAWYSTAAFGENLCWNGTFDNNSEAGWSMYGAVGAVLESLQFDNDNDAYARWDAPTPTIGTLTKVTFDRGRLGEESAIWFTCGGHTGIQRVDYGTYSEEFTPTTYAPLTFHVGMGGADETANCDNIVFQQWEKAESLLDHMSITTNVSSLIPRAGGEFHATIRVYHAPTGHLVYDDTRALALVGNAHD